MQRTSHLRTNISSSLSGARNTVRPPRSYATNNHSNRKPWPGDVVYLSAFGKPVIVLNSAQAAIELLDKRSAIYSSRPHSHMADVMGYRSSTLLAPYGEAFRKARRVLNSALNSRVAKTYWPIQEGEVHSYLKRLLESPEHFREHIKRTSGGIILKVAYGYSLEKSNDPVLPLVEAATDSFGRAVTGGHIVDYIPFRAHRNFFLFT